MNAAAAFFYLFSSILVASAFMVVSSRNPVHSVLFLILAFVNAAGLFLLLDEQASTGRVAFAGPFRSFGVLLIIDCGGGYHFVLAGLDRLDAEAGSRLLAGEPVGVLGSGDSARSKSDRG